MFKKYLPVLSKTSLFQNVEANDLNTMLGCLQPKLSEFKKNSFIAIAGNPFESMGILLKGEAALIKENAAGNRMIMAILKPGEIFGESAVFSRKSVWPTTVVAQETCTVMFLAKQKILGECANLCSWHRKIIENMLKDISDKTLMLNKKLEYLSMKSMRGKLSSFLLGQYKINGSLTFMLPMKRNELADYLNVSRPSMSREMCRMRDEGVIDFHLSSIQIKDIESLKDMVE
ncbi:transcriptional regulator [Desulfosporosinus sp. Tol-M]|nr:transcriptional regulator [Desulfosporosinus sp. Tol-M]